MTSNRFLWEATPVHHTGAWPLTDGLPTLFVDLSRPDAPWPAVHPGIHDADGGHRAHRIVTAFDVVHSEDAVLHLEYAAERGPCPDLEVTLDGRKSLHHLTVERARRTTRGMARSRASRTDRHHRPGRAGRHRHDRAMAPGHRPPPR